MADDRRLIEDYLPIQAISKEASREKNVRKGHISTLHLWWARRPLVACRAAVYGALVPASQFVPSNGPDNKKQSLGRANAAKFVTELCKYPGSPRIIAQAQEHILDAHAERLMAELAQAVKTRQWPAWVDEFKWPKNEKQVTRHDIEKGRAPRPRVLDMFAGGGAIPLEVLRLGCQAYALDLNPVAHIIQLCMLVYPQRYRKPDPTTQGTTGPKNAKGESTWGGLAEEVRHWGNWVLERVKAEVGDLYPLISDPTYKGNRAAAPDPTLFKLDAKAKTLSPGYLTPIAYLWTRTVTCKNPACAASVPLLKQTWLCKRKQSYKALERVPLPSERRVRFDLREATSQAELGFDPEEGSYRGSTSCPCCGTTIDNQYVMAEGCSGRILRQLMCIVVPESNGRGKRYLTDADVTLAEITPTDDAVLSHPAFQAADLSALRAKIPSDKRESFWCRRYGIDRYEQAFTPRQMLFLATTARIIRSALIESALDEDRRRALACYLSCLVDKLADYNSVLTHWDNTSQAVKATYARQALPMVWDFPEINPFAGALADGRAILKTICDVIETCPDGPDAQPERSSATQMPYDELSIDAVVTDPPYYDNISYSKLADYFYVWMRQVLHPYFPEHFASEATPKKQEAIVDIARSNGDREAARHQYEDLMRASFLEAHRVLKSGGSLACVYAHKTMAGWAALVDTLRSAGFVIVEAWPLDTEMKGRVRAAGNASLASSVFLMARKRPAGAGTAEYDNTVRPELLRIVQERIATLWEQGITGADLVIASVGAGLRAFTKYERVEYANGEEVPAERFLAEVEGVVLDLMLHQIAGKVARGVTSIDAPSRFYVLWRYVYKTAAIEAGEAIVFTYGQHVELDGQTGLATGNNSLVEKKKSTYRLRDFSERGKDEKLGLPPENGQPGETASLIDALHRVLWIMENRPRLMTEFLRESRVNRDQLRVLAQALAGPALKGGELGEVSGGEELAALTRLTSNWKSVIEDALMPLERGAR